MRLTTKAQRLAARWRPASSTEHLATNGGAAYTYDTPALRAGYALIAYRGSAGRPDFHTTYRTAEQRDHELSTWLQRQNRVRPGTDRPSTKFDPTAPTKSRYSLTETAAIVRHLAAQLWPGVKFSVRSESYSMGCAIRVEWTDGPTTSQVGAVVKVMDHKGFDGMTDSSYCHPPLDWRGCKVTFGADYITTRRNESAEMLREVAASDGGVYSD